MAKRKPRRRPLLALVGFYGSAAVAALAVVAAIIHFASFERPRVVSAYGVAVCGLTHHVVLIYGDGRQRIVKGEAIISDKEVTEAVENLPPTKAGAFNICPPKAPPLKVY